MEQPGQHGLTRRGLVDREPRELADLRARVPQAADFSAVEFVVKRQNCAAGITKNMLDTVADQAINQSESTRCTPDGDFSF